MSGPAATDIDSLHHSHRPPTIISHEPNERVDTMYVRVDENEVMVAGGGRVVARDR